MESMKLNELKFLSKVEELDEKTLKNINGGYWENLGYQVFWALGRGSRNASSHRYGKEARIRGTFSIPY